MINKTNNFSSFGGDLPVKIKIITGTTAAAEGTSTTVAHGLTYSKIIGATVQVNKDDLTYLYPEHIYSTERQYSLQITTTNVQINNHATNSGAILSKPFTVLIFYIE